MSFQNPKRTKKKGLPCEYCNSDDTRVLHTDRRWLRKRPTHRRHLCKNCGRKFNTVQIYKTRYRELLALEEKRKSLYR